MPSSISLGVFEVSLYALILVVAVMACLVTSIGLAQRSNVPSLLLLRLLSASVLWMLIFGRLFYVLNPPPSVAQFYDRAWYLSSFTDLQAGALAIWAGGLDRAGLLLGVLIGSKLVTRRTHFTLMLLIDRLYPALLFGLTISALANLPNQDLLGPPTNLPWGMVAAGQPYDAFPAGTRFHPVPAYISLATCFVLLFCLWLDRRKPAWRWRLSYVASGAYLLLICFADFFRLDVSRVLLNLTMLQIVCFLLLLWLGWDARTTRSRANKL